MTTSYLQLALNVRDIETATGFYRDLFGIAPARQRPGYASLVIADPPLNLVLFENPGGASPLNHLGVELRSAADMAAAVERFAAAKLRHSTAEGDRCCQGQDTVWVDAPDVPLAAWTFTTALTDNPLEAAPCPTGSCAPAPAGSAPCCAATPRAA
jgi:catechol 2,3-dioxygenase-like lactoylglutathione lyase family enzyme